MTTMIIDGIDIRMARHAMVVSQLRPNAVTDQRVVASMATLPRERFVPASSREIAYRDTLVPFGNGRYLNTPLATARLLNEAYIVPGDAVLLIGAATGYAANILAGMAARVVAVENAPDLIGDLRRNVAGLANVEIVDAELVAGPAEGGSFDVLIIDGAVRAVPARLYDMVKDGGRATSGLIERGVTRLAAGGRSAGGFGLQAFADVECAVLPGFEQPETFRF